MMYFYFFTKVANKFAINNSNLIIIYKTYFNLFKK